MNPGYVGIMNLVQLLSFLPLCAGYSTHRLAAIATDNNTTLCLRI